MPGGGIFSIGHSTHPVDHFMDLLKRHGIDVVADVRSSPYSRFNPQFNRQSLADALKQSGIKYAFFGKDLGARADDPSCYLDGRVQYARLAARADFGHAIDRLLAGAEDHRIALMCSEKEPLECHRTILVSQALIDAKCPVTHILHDGTLETHDATLERLLQLVGSSNEDMFSSRSDLMSEALSKQESRIAYVKTTTPEFEGMGIENEA